jgi:opacity protein-like surface antigen
MRRAAAVLVGVLLSSGMARAQSGANDSRGYVEAVAQSAFGNVTSQSFGGEIGVTVAGGWQVFVEAGQVRDTSPSDLGASAQAIAGFLARTQANVGYRVKEPVTFGIAGVRYVFPGAGRVEPYVLAGGGIAQVKRDVTFTVGGADVTSSLQQAPYYVTLGSDLSGSETKPMVGAGVGIVWPAWRRLAIDFQYRFGRVFASDQGLNVNRAGVGIGVRF